MSTISTGHTRSFHLQELRQASALPFFPCCFGLDSVEVFSFPSLDSFRLMQVFLDSIRIPHVVSSCETSLSTRAAHDFDATSGGGTGGSWCTVLTHVLWSRRAVGSQGYGTKEENPQR